MMGGAGLECMFVLLLRVGWRTSIAVREQDLRSAVRVEHKCPRGVQPCGKVIGMTLQSPLAITHEHIACRCVLRLEHRTERGPHARQRRSAELAERRVGVPV